MSLRTRNLRAGISGEFTFTLLAEPLPGDLRPIWRICVLLLMLMRCGFAGKMSLKKAHLLNWGVLTRDSRTTLLRMLEGERNLWDLPVRFDPALNRALDYASAEGLIHMQKKTTGSIIQLLPSGEAIATQIDHARDCLEIEKAFFNSLRGKLPEAKVKELLEWETDL